MKTENGNRRRKDEKGTEKLAREREREITNDFERSQEKNGKI